MNNDIEESLNIAVSKQIEANIANKCTAEANKPSQKCR